MKTHTDLPAHDCPLQRQVSRRSHRMEAYLEEKEDEILSQLVSHLDSYRRFGRPDSERYVHLFGVGDRGSDGRARKSSLRRALGIALREKPDHKRWKVMLETPLSDAPAGQDTASDLHSG